MDKKMNKVKITNTLPTDFVSLRSFFPHHILAWIGKFFHQITMQVKIWIVIFEAFQVKSVEPEEFAINWY